MPELPDVEVFKRYLDSTSLRQRVESVEIREQKILGSVSVRRLQNALKGREFESTRRHGKHLFVGLSGGDWLMLHFGMTGRLKYFKDPENGPPHDRMLVTFDTGYRLAFDDQRIFGRVDMISSPEDFIEEHGLGPDPLSLGPSTFKERLAGKRSAVKSALMNQRVLAGIGNVYSDEILFQTRLHPKTELRSLAGADLGNLHKATRRVLEKAIENGADPAKLPDSYLLPHRREGGECPRCGGEIAGYKVSGRTAYFCPACQK